MDVDEVKTGQLSRRNFQSSCPISKKACEIRDEEQPKSLYHAVVADLKENQKVQWLFFIFYATSVLLDYLFVYMPKIDDEKKCILSDESLGITAVVFHMTLDFLSIIIIITSEKMRESGKKYFLKSLQIKWNQGRTLLFHQFINILLFTPVVQVLVLITLTSNGHESLLFPAITSLLILHTFRVAAMIKLLLITRRSSASRLSNKFAYLFVFIYIYSSQSFAALWYVLSLNQETQCWKKAYKEYRNDTSSNNYDIFQCVKTSNQSNNITAYINDYCSTFRGNYNCSTDGKKYNCSADIEKYDFGIYAEIHESGILKMDTPRKILYFSRWSLQILSSFCQGLKAGADVSANFFVIFIILSGVIMFFFLIGEDQSRLQILAKVKQKLQETEKWMSSIKISKDLQSQVKKYQKYKQWKETKDAGVNIQNLLNDLPEDLRREITQKLCINLLKKVEEFGSWCEVYLEELCNCVKPVFYAERTRIIREGDPIDEMIFIVQGKLWTYTKAESLSIAYRQNSRNDYLKDGDFYGKKLLYWVQANPYTSNLPISTRTIQALTKVEAFVLMADDLKNIFKQNHAALFILTLWRFKRELHLRRNAQTPTQEPSTTSTISVVSEA